MSLTFLITLLGIFIYLSITKYIDYKFSKFLENLTAESQKINDHTDQRLERVLTLLDEKFISIKENINDLKEKQFNNNQEMP